MILHVTTVHSRNDIRIRVKELATLSNFWPQQVALLVQDGLGPELSAADGVKVYDAGPRESRRLRRMTFGAFRMFRAIRRFRPRVVHFHDPELLPWAVLLGLSKVRVIYDAHEDLPAAILSKPYIAPCLRRPVAAIICFIERFLAARLDGVIAATPAIQENFRSSNTAIVQNFPLCTELQATNAGSHEDRPLHFAYVGGITAIRGAVEMVAAINILQAADARLQMAGLAADSLQATLEAMPGWERVAAHGWADRTEVAQILSQCRAGLVLFHPEPNHIRSQPNKLFEYMAAGLPIIASDFPLWRGLVDGVGCGILVDPLDPGAIANAMQWILDNPREAAEMGQAGREAVENQFNWEAESTKLLAFYKGLLADI